MKIKISQNSDELIYGGGSDLAALRCAARAPNPCRLETSDGARTFERARGCLVRAQEAANSFDQDGRKEGIKQFIDDKTYKPGIGTYDVAKGS